MKSLPTFFALLMVTACSPTIPPDSAVSSYFFEHQKLINELAELGISHPALRRVEPSLKKYPDYYGTPSQADLVAEKHAYEILVSLKADYVSYYHDGSLSGNPLVYIEVPFYRFGLSLGGHAKCLRYFPSQKKDLPMSNVFKYTAISDGWYIAESDTR